MESDSSKNSEKNHEKQNLSILRLTKFSILSNFCKMRWPMLNVITKIWKAFTNMRFKCSKKENKLPKRMNKESSMTLRNKLRSRKRI